MFLVFVLQKEQFIHDAPTDSMAQFLQWFCETQMFEVFITEQTERNRSAKKKGKTIGKTGLIGETILQAYWYLSDAKKVIK